MDVTKHEFEIDYIQTDISWLHCPEEATTICRSYGGHLVKIQGFNPNQGVGELVENFISKLNQELSNINGSLENDGLSFWIGLKRNGYGNYSWSDGEVAQVYEGFWSLGQPSGFQRGFEQCCRMDVNIYDEYGSYRWSLGSCETRLPFLCEVSACVAGQFRCADGKKCISPTWLCDGVKDCLDESDELDCKEKCGGYLTGTQGSLHSPNYPHSYPHYSFCHWKIEVPAGKRINLEFEFFSLEDKYDTLSVYDGSSNTDPLIATYTGNSTSQVPLSKSNYLVVIFSSDHDGAKQGFNVTWQAVTYESCGGNLVADKDIKYFTSPEYPQKYSDNLLCDWIISNPDPGKVVSLQFESFSMGDENDWVEIRDGEFESSSLFIRYTGAVDMATVFVSSGNKLFVRLKTDSVHRGHGFNASYQGGCDVTVNRGYATIFSPGYSLTDYPSNIRCSWAITQFENKELALVYDGIKKTSANKLREFSGKNVPSPVRSKEILVEFSSDNQVQRSGWMAVVSYDCPSLYPLQSHSSFSTSVTQYGTVVQFSCDIGYHINGPNSIICDIGGKWNTSVPTCNIINCGSPLIPKNGGLLSLNSTFFGVVAIYRCNLGYTLLGNHKVSCTENGWTNYPSCEDSIYIQHLQHIYIYIYNANSVSGVTFIKKLQNYALILYLCLCLKFYI
ncbi:hypothetical protein KUTeg_003697 [Tegillarca granosa]|uniref:Uncharacterized protein n=1 Tax=Tegillarca granosa TaxID=220873 RepID=A0ABQ9FMU9_TEGGR|nr:hypothetical protein KUTeg_003697 [Tegillarca granosa]